MMDQTTTMLTAIKSFDLCAKMTYDFGEQTLLSKEKQLQFAWLIFKFLLLLLATNLSTRLAWI